MWKAAPLIFKLSPVIFKPSFQCDTVPQLMTLIVLGLETQTKPLYRLCMILDRLEEGCKLVLALAIAPVGCEVMGDVVQTNLRSCNVL
jgi:hypothetical protein